MTTKQKTIPLSGMVFCLKPITSLRFRHPSSFFMRDIHTKTRMRQPCIRAVYLTSVRYIVVFYKQRKPPACIIIGGARVRKVAFHDLPAMQPNYGRATTGRPLPRNTWLFAMRKAAFCDAKGRLQATRWFTKSYKATAFHCLHIPLPRVRGAG